VFPPPRFDDYQVLGPLGAGGMGTVFLGRDHMLDRKVALKFISAVSPDARSRERFLQEARALARLHHPNVAGVYRIGAVEGRPYLAYELVDGDPLHQLPWPLPWRRALRLAVGISRGLAAVHAAGVLHRDIKPSNIVTASGDVPKLIDFGLASRLDEYPSGITVASPPALSSATTAQASVSGAQIAGTPAYMAPELWAGAAPSAASDVYAFGLVMWQLVAGALPFDELAGDEMIVAVRTRAVPSILTRRDDLPQPFADLIDRCVARIPDDRPSSVWLRDHLEALRALYAPLVDSGALDAEEQRVADELAASFTRATDDPDRFSRAFYERAFSLAPELRPLFPSDLSALRLKLVSALQTIVRNARAPERLVPMLEDLGERHHAYGVQPGNFDVMGRALLATLAAMDEAHWSASTEALWTSAYQNIARHMTRGLERAASGSLARATPPLSRVPIEPPEPRFVTAGGVTLGYQVFGNGPIDLLFIPGWFGHLEIAWHEPRYARFLSRLAQRARVIAFDRRGTGLSDRAPGSVDLDAQIADALAVLDAAGAERPIVLGISDGTTVAAGLAALHPERARALVLYGGSPCWAERPDHAGAPAARVDQICELIRTRWGTALFLEDMAPSRVDDEAYRAWWARHLRTAVAPAMATTLIRHTAALDVRIALPAVRAPTLVLQRRGDRPHILAGGRAYASLIAGARLCEVDGNDHVLHAGDAEPVIEAIEGFLRETPTAVTVGHPSRLATALAVRTDASDDLGPLRAAIEREGGAIVEEADGALAAVFALPEPALRAVAAAPASARSVVRSASILRSVEAEGAFVAAACASLDDVAPGMTVLDEAAAGLAARAAGAQPR
jgi:serine/threonine protein kinase/pimeloyl-ACP methyl ester carboxylesterase